MELAKSYWHVDNGGITVKVSQDEMGNITVSFDTNYFGYPSVSTSLDLFGGVGKMSQRSFLKELGILFIDSANKAKDMKEE